MSLELYLAFVLATAVLIVVPGPANALIVANSIAHGGRRTLVTVAGVSAASVVHLGLVALGMTSLMALLSEGFEWLRWAGVAYLVALGIRQWRARPVALDDRAMGAVSGRRLFWTGFVVDATNPKTLFFYAAFFPSSSTRSRPSGRRSQSFASPSWRSRPCSTAPSRFWAGACAGS